MPLLLKPVFTRAYLFLFILGIVSSHVTQTQYDNTCRELLFDTYLICAALLLIPQRLKIGGCAFPLRLPVKAVFYVLFYSLYVIDTFCFVKFGSTINPSILLLVGETTGREASEFLSVYVTPDLICSGVGLTALVPLAHMATAALWKRYGHRAAHTYIHTYIHTPPTSTGCASPDTCPGRSTPSCSPFSFGEQKE